MPGAGPTDVTPRTCPRQVGGRMVSVRPSYLTGLMVEQKPGRTLIKSIWKPLWVSRNQNSVCLQTKLFTVSVRREGERKGTEQGHGVSYFLISLSSFSALCPPPGQQSLSLLVPGQPPSALLQVRSHNTLWIMWSCRESKT